MDRESLITAQLIDDYMRRPVSRRVLLRRAAALGLSTPTIFVLLAACGAAVPSGTTSSPGTATSPGTPTSPGPSKAAGAPDPTTLVVASGAAAVTLDPGVSFDGQSPLLWRAVYEPLVNYKGDTVDIVPHLAESYDISADGLTYTFKIRQGVKFSDGETLDAAAVKTNIERQISVKQGIAYALAPIKSMETPDAYTLVLKIDAPSDALLSAFAGMYTVGMISPKVLTEKATGGDFAQGYMGANMVGTGPYLLESYTQSQQASFKRNPDYWAGWNGQHAERLVVSYITEPTSERLTLEQGDTDMALFLPDDVVEGLDGKPGIFVTDVPSFNLYYIVLPTTKGPTKDKTVRQAISYGFDYQTWVNKTLRGKAVQARGPIPSNFIGFDPTTPQYSYDPQKAKQLLAQTAYPNGGFTIKYVYETGYWWKRPLGEQFQANMLDLGIKVDIQELSPAAWAGLLSNPKTAEHAFGLVWWPTLKTPYDFMFSIFATGAQGTAAYNWGYYSNPTFDNLLEEATHTVDEAKRNEVYGQCQKILVEDAPALFVYEKHYRLPMRDWVKGFVFNGVYIETLDWYNLSKM
jgi:peptide/nickel transport system substrate-binding protein